MGGKNKQSQRTKNNARPSSSGRSAELLSNTQFSGFSGMKETGFIMPTFSLTNNHDLELDIDTNFQLVFKKMNKKDSTTKLKALQEFADLVRNSDPEIVKAVLPLWPRLFNVLATDSEHKVREATHLAHNEVVQKVKRNLAPYLKQLIAAWFTSQYDTYPPASSAATSSFNAAFPERKVEEVVAFCNEEILNYIHDNLLVSTPQTIHNPKHNTPEDAEAKYERVLISSLLGYSLYFKKIQIEKLETSIELNKKIINSSKFWKYSKHNLSVVRAAWFEVLTAIFQKAPFLLENEEVHITSTTLGSIDETDPVVLPLVWQNVLLTVTSIKEWWTKVNVEKVMLPKLWKVLKKGGQGNASVIYPNLLPLLSNLMNVINGNTLYTNFFQNLSIGLQEKSVISSKSESSAVSTSLIECIRYVIMKNESDTNLCETIIKSHLISTIEWCLLETQSCYKIIFNQTASITQYWSRNTSENPNYIRYLNFFWNNIDLLFQEVLTNLDSFESEKIVNISDRQIEFLLSMKHTVKVKKSLRVKFNFENESNSENTNLKNTNQPDECYLTSLTNLVHKIIKTYINLINAKNSKELLDHLTSLIQEFDSENLFLFINKEMDFEEGSGIIVIFENLLKNWLFCENLCCKSLVDFIFIIYKYLDNEGKETILENFDKVSNEECLGWCLEKALSHEYNKDPFIQKWLNSDSISNFLVEITKKIISNECPSNFNSLLKLTLTENEKEELCISDKAISKILEILNQPLLNPNSYLDTIDLCASLASYISTVVYTEHYKLTFGDDLLLALIILSSNIDIDPEYLSIDTNWEVQTAWQDACSILASNLSKDELELILKKVIVIIQKCMDGNYLDFKTIEKFVEILTNISRSIYKEIPLDMDRILKILLDHSFVHEWKSSITNICKISQYLNGKLTSCYEELNLSTTVRMDDHNILKFFTWNYFKINILMASIESYVPDDFENDEDENVKFWSVLDTRIEWIADLLYDLELANCFLEDYKTVKFSKNIKDYNEGILSKYTELIKSLNIDDQNNLKAYIKNKCFCDSWLWSRTMYNLCINLLMQDPLDVYDYMVKDATSVNKLTVVHTTQIFSKHLNFDYVFATFDDINRVIFLRCLAHCQNIDVQIAEVMSALDIFRNTDVKTFNCESFKMEWPSYQRILETSRLFNELIKYQFDSLSRRHIDLIIISLAEWLTHLVQFYKSSKVQTMIIAIIELYQSILNTINELQKKEEKLMLTKEWNDLFAEGIQNDIVKLWLHIADDLKTVDHSSLITTLPLMYCFDSIANCFDHKLIFKSSEEKPTKWSKLLKVSCVLLKNPITTIQLAAYKTIMSLINGLVEIDSLAVNTNTPSESGLIFEQFKEICISMQDIINAMLMGLKLGENSCRIEPFTDSYNYTLAYLLIWDIVLTLCENASTELKYQYADWLRQEDLLKNLFNNLFRLLPSEILNYSDSKKLHHVDWFSSRVPFNAKSIFSSIEIEHMVCWIYCFTLSQLPALVRQWWSGTETKIAQVVERITSAYVSPLICNQELTGINKHEKTFKNMTVKVLPTIREVVATYTVDEAQMELIITLPTNYPLAGPEVYCNRQIGGTSHKQWLMQFKKCVLHQNGRIWDGLSLWNNNLDKKFDGVEECYICFSVLHPGTYQLPKLSCQTCRKKFHSACLYKWFSTSNKSSCPICRNLF